WHSSALLGLRGATFGGSVGNGPPARPRVTPARCSPSRRT
ncbi:MAG: hypothetical protein AVDCRST_MAG77-3945, partial [uncultured Chloroflexi bacterium]